MRGEDRREREGKWKERRKEERSSRGYEVRGEVECRRDRRGRPVGNLVVTESHIDFWRTVNQAKGRGGGRGDEKRSRERRKGKRRRKRMWKRVKCNNHGKGRTPGSRRHLPVHTSQTCGALNMKTS